MRKYFALFIAVIISLTLLVGCNNETPKVDLPETLDTVGNIDTAPPATEAEETVGSVDTTPPVIDPLPIILEEEVDGLPNSVGEALFVAWRSTYYPTRGADTLDFYRMDRSGETYAYYKLTLTLPSGYSNGRIHKTEIIPRGALESENIRFVVEATRDGEDVYLEYILGADFDLELYVLESVTEITEEDLPPILVERPLEFVNHTFTMGVGTTVSFEVPYWWELSYTDNSNAYLDEEDILNVLPYDKYLKRVLVIKTDTDFDKMIGELKGGSNPYNFDSVISGTTSAGHEYAGVRGDFRDAFRYIFCVTTEHESYIFEVWEWRKYDTDLNFLDDVVIPVVESFSVEYDTTPPVIDTLPIILEEEVDGLPDSIGAAMIKAWFSGARGDYYYFPSGADTLEFYRVDYSGETTANYKLTLTLPDGYSNGKIHKAETTSGGATSDGLRFIVEAEYFGKKFFLDYTMTANKGSGLYVLSSVRRTTEEEFTRVLGDRTLEFVTHGLYLQVGVNVSLALPSYWELDYHGNGNAYFYEEDILNIYPRSLNMKRALFFKTDRDFDTILADLAGDTNPIGDAVFLGTTVGGHEYKGICQTVDGCDRYIFSVVTEREMYILEVWSQPEYDVGVDFFNDVVIPVVESFSVEYHEKVTITDIADWDTLPWVEKPYDYRKRAQSAYNFIYDMVSGEDLVIGDSSYSELKDLGIEDYSITLLSNDSSEATLRFTFTVTGNSLPETLPPGTYTKILQDGVGLSMYDEKIPDSYLESYNENRGLDKFGDYTAVQAIHEYLCHYNYSEPYSFGEWPDDIPYPYICTYYGNNSAISFDEMQKLLSEKFGITIEKPDESCSTHRWEYNADTGMVYYTDTRAFPAIYRFIDVKEDGGTTYVTVQFYADYLFLIPSHKIVYRLGEGEVFLGCEVIDNGHYHSRSINWENIIR
ncbi:MAG: hypothetical protein E7627_04040 [Ruminococcaceae bacterium]|nr:hypothetical protein [Oscillospiraceae bacterium]